MRVLILLVFAALATEAIAQIAPGMSGTSTKSYFSGQAVWDELSEFGKCYAGVGRSDALKLVGTKAGTEEEAQAYRRLFGNPDLPCMGNVEDLRVPPAMVRGAIAEGLYFQRVPVPANLAVTSPVSREQVRSLSDAALCYVGRHREEAQALVERTRPGTKDEAAAVESLFPNLSECLPPNANGVSLTTTLVRFRIAEALWRLGMVRSSADQGASR